MQAHFLFSFSFKLASSFPSPSHLLFWPSFFVSLLMLHCFAHVPFFHTITPKHFSSAALPSHCFSLPMSQASLLTITSKNLLTALGVIFSVLLVWVLTYLTSTHFISYYIWLLLLQAPSSWVTVGLISQQLFAHFSILLSQLSHIHVLFAYSTISRSRIRELELGDKICTKT